MIYLNQTYELLAGGFHAGNRSWNKRHTEIDNCFKLYQLTEGNVHVCSDQDDFTLEKGKMYFINGSKLSKQYCKESFSTHWIHFLPKDLMIYQGLLDLPAVVEIETNGISFIGLAYRYAAEQYQNLILGICLVNHACTGSDTDRDNKADEGLRYHCHIYQNIQTGTGHALHARKL